MRPCNADSFMAGNKVSSEVVDDDGEEDDTVVDVVSLPRNGLGQPAPALDFYRVLSAIGQPDELLRIGRPEPSECEENRCRHVWDPVAAGPAVVRRPPDDGLMESELQRVNRESMRNYAAFRENMLHQFAVARQRRHQQGCHLLDDRAAGQSSSDSKDSGTYQPRLAADGGCFVERRKKNNEAAKRSRDARRAKEDEVTIRAAFLEQENVQLRWEVARLAADTADLARACLAVEAEEALATAHPQIRTTP